MREMPGTWKCSTTSTRRGGTSGSAVFDHQGWVVAVNHAGSVTRVPIPGGDTISVGAGSLNFGIRVDAVWDFLDVLEGSAQAPAFLDDPVRQRAYPHETYQPFPANWNGETLVP